MTVRTTKKYKNPRSNGKSEHREQADFVVWWRKNKKELIFAVPNGGKRGPITAAKLKIEGVLPGVWDLFCPELKLWIEFKRAKTGSLSQDQRRFGERMLQAGYRCMVAWGCEDAIDQTINGERTTWKRPKR